MKTILMLFCGFSIAVSMQAQIRFVPSQYPTIQDGINAANPGDTVLVDEGTYFEQINFLGKKPLMVASRYLLDGNESHISNTIVDGSQLSDLKNGSVVYFVSGEDTTSILCGFTICHGKGTLYRAAGYNIRGGGGISINLSGAKIMNNHITENHLNDTLHGNSQIISGAGIEARWIKNDHWVVIENNEIDHNSTFGSKVESSGAGFYITCNSRITGNIISDNTARAKGTSVASGAGFSCVTDTAWGTLVTAIVRDNVIRDNLSEAVNNYANAAGGLLGAVTGVFSGNEVETNEVISWSLSGGVSGLLVLSPREGIVICNNIFRDNTSNNWTGGLHLESGTASPFTNPLVVENNYFIHNEAVNGGAFSTINVPVKLQNNVFSGNHASQWGGAAYLLKEVTSNLNHLVTMVNNSFYGNTARNEGGAIYSLNCKPLIFNTIFYKDSTHNHPQEIFAHLSSDTVEIAFSNIDPGLIHVYNDENLITEEGNISVDPLFIDPETLHPAVWSPCVDAGTSQYIHMGSLMPGPSFDILGTARPAGTAFDMGAYDDVSGGVMIAEIANVELHMMSWPNPFTGSTTISYTLPEAAQVVIRIFDSFGRLVDEPRFAWQLAGEQKVCWNAATLPAGLYFCRIEAGGRAGGVKMVKK